MKFVRTQYGYNNNLAVMAYEDDGEPYGRLTVNIDKLPNDEAALDTNNWKDAESVAKSLGAVPTGKMLASGFCTYPVYKFDLSKLES